MSGSGLASLALMQVRCPWFQHPGYNDELSADLSVVGFDDIPVAAFLGPPLTTVSVPKEELGHQAWVMLRQQMEDGKVAPEKWLPSSLVVRSSTAPPARRHMSR